LVDQLFGRFVEDIISETEFLNAHPNTISYRYLSHLYEEANTALQTIRKAAGG
jgi:hypothetical protein